MTSSMPPPYKVGRFKSRNQGGTRLKAFLALTAATVLSATVTLAAPGDPFGGDDTGCVPDTVDHLKCEVKVAKLFAKLIRGVTTCHIAQASAGFKGSGFGEGGCEQAAKAKFDGALLKLTNTGACSQALLDNAAAQEAVLLAGQTQTSPPSMDTLNGSFFCDSASGALLANVNGDNDNDDAGWVPANGANLKCEVSVAKNVVKFWGGLMSSCHAKAAAAGFKGVAYDEETCENNLRTKYSAVAAKLLTSPGLCPPCLDASAQAALAGDAEARADQENGQTFVCP